LTMVKPKPVMPMGWLGAAAPFKIWQCATGIQDSARRKVVCINVVTHALAACVRAFDDITCFLIDYILQVASEGVPRRRAAHQPVREAAGAAGSCRETAGRRAAQDARRVGVWEPSSQLGIWTGRRILFCLCLRGRWVFGSPGENLFDLWRASWGDMKLAPLLLTDMRPTDLGPLHCCACEGSGRSQAW
jgi:hypothetical protein